MDLNWQTTSSKKNRIITKIAAIVLTAAFVLTGITPSFAAEIKPSAKIDWSDAPGIEGTSAILMDAGTGEILYEKNSHEVREPASITKMITALIVLETMDLDEEITVSYDVSLEGTDMGIKKGEVFTVEQLLYAIMLRSANDAAEVLAVEAGGSVENFSDMMNERAKRCGALNSNFVNPNGMNGPGNEGHHSTAYDLAVIAREAMKNETFREIVATVEYTIPATNLSKKRKFRNSNRCLVDGKGSLTPEEKAFLKGNYRYEGTLGVKTGYTSTAGNCFCGMAERNGTELIAVTLNSTSLETRFNDVMTLWDYGFSKYDTHTVAKSKEAFDEVVIKRGAKRAVPVTVQEDMDILLNKGDDGEITANMRTYQDKRKAPIKKGDALGHLTAYRNGVPVAEAELYAMENVEKGGILSWIGIPDEDLPLFFVGLASIAIVLFLIRNILMGTRRKRRLRKRARRQRNVRRKEWEKEKNPFDYYDHFKDFK